MRQCRGKVFVVATVSWISSAPSAKPLTLLHGQVLIVKVWTWQRFGETHSPARCPRECKWHSFLKGTCTTPTKVFLNQQNLIVLYAFRKVQSVITHGTHSRTSSSVQWLSCVWFFVTPWTTACHASLSITNSQSLLKLTSIESVMPTNHLILHCPLLLLPSIFPSIKVFSNESALHIRWPKDWSFSFSISPSNEYSGLISFRMDWLHLLAIQGILKSLLQHHSPKASILWYSAFFIVQLSHPYMTTGKTIALTRWTFVGKVMSLLFNMLSRWLRR